MQPAEQNGSPVVRERKKPGCLKTGLIVLAVAVVTCGLTVWVMTTLLFPKQLKPVKLSENEKTVLDAKLDRLEAFAETADSADPQSPVPEAYSEEGAERTIRFSQRELNGLLARNPDWAKRVAVHLSDDLASAKILIPVDPDFPLLGGKTIKASAGLSLSYADGRPVVILKGVSLWGTPIPNAWLGGLKNVDLVQEFGGSGGFWDVFADGVDFINIDDGQLTIRLKE
jgi:hypothetical protein